jgi:hypothetical protein
VWACWWKFPQLPKRIRGKKRFLNQETNCLNTSTSTHLLSWMGMCISLIFPLNQPKKKRGGKQALECSRVDKFTKTWEDENPKVDKMSKEFFAFLDTF